ncbi:MAG: retroviral-like aspartic protease family protein [Rhodomicrobium sp.]
MWRGFLRSKSFVYAFLAILALIIASQPAKGAEACRSEKKAALMLAATLGFMTVPARINGTAVTMGLDTGARTFVTPEAVSRLKLPRHFGRRTRLIGTTAIMTVDNVLISDLEFADDHFRDQSVASIPVEGKVMFGQPGLIGTEISGLIGADIMSHYDFELDFELLRLTPYKVTGCKAVKPEWTGSYSQTPFEITGLRKIAIPVEIDGVKLRAILDTGANASAITRSGAMRAGLTAAALERPLPHIRECLSRRAEVRPNEI